MANKMKIKGDREEIAVERIVQEKFPKARRTRPGRREDCGDVDIPEADAIAQCKDVKTTQWSTWLEELADQKRHSGASTAFLSVKRSRPGKSPLRLAVMPLDEFLLLLERAT